jgi:hypothetical protein
MYITASPSPNRTMCVRALLDDTTGSVLRLLPPAIAPEAKICSVAPRNPLQVVTHLHHKTRYIGAIAMFSSFIPLSI